MMSKTFDCAECGASAPYGRLSCPSCGALLASVTGALRPALRATQVESQPDHRNDTAPTAVTASVAVAEAPGASNGKTHRRPAAPVARLKPVAAAAAVAVPAPAPATSTAPATPAPSPMPTRAAVPPATAQPAMPAAPSPVAPRPPTTTPASTPAPAPSVPPTQAGPRTPHYAPTPAVAARTRAAAAATAAEQHAEAARVAAPAAPAPAANAPTPEPNAKTLSDAQRAAIVPLLEPSAIATMPSTPWAPLVEPAPALVGRPYQRHLASETDPTTADGPPSAYRPPSLGTAMALGVTVAKPDGAGRIDQSTDDPADAAAPAKAAKPSYRWLESIPEPEGFVEIAGWFVVVGSTMSLLGFLLPWSRVVIGASTIGGYFDGWGLASPTHLLVFVGLLGVLALALRRGPLSPWISSGILGLVFGGLLLGLAWPYLIGPLGSDVGLTMTALGAVALLIGGVVTLWATRHVVAEPVV